MEKKIIIVCEGKNDVSYLNALQRFVENDIPLPPGQLDPFLRFVPFPELEGTCTGRYDKIVAAYNSATNGQRGQSPCGPRTPSKASAELPILHPPFGYISIINGEIVECLSSIYNYRREYFACHITERFQFGSHSVRIC